MLYTRTIELIYVLVPTYVWVYVQKTVFVRKLLVFLKQDNCVECSETQGYTMKFLNTLEEIQSSFFVVIKKQTFKCFLLYKKLEELTIDKLLRLTKNM